MSKKTPKGKTPSLIGGSNGKPALADVKRACKCYRCSTDLLKGTCCIEIPHLGGAFTNKRRVCGDCFSKIIEQTAKDLEELQHLLDDV